MRSTSFRDEDVFGSDLEAFPAVMRDMSDVRRLTELNPLLQQGMARPKAAEYLHLEEFEDGSEKGGGRFFSHITTTLGTGYMFFATAGFASALAVQSVRMSIGHNSVPWRVKRTAVINYTAKKTYKLAMNSAKIGVGFIVGNSVLENLRGKPDVFNVIAGFGLSGFLLGLSGGIAKAARFGGYSSLFVAAFAALEHSLGKWMTPEREEAIMKRIRSVRRFGRPDPKEVTGTLEDGSGSLSSRRY